MRQNKRNGQAVVEMALVLPVFILIIMGIFDFGRAFHCWSTLNYQCVQAARKATKRKNQLVARNLFLPSSHTSLDEVRAEFWNFKSPMMAESDYVSGPVFDGVGVNGAKTVTVSAQYKLSIVTPLLGAVVDGAAGDGNLTISASATEKKE